MGALDGLRAAAVAPDGDLPALPVLAGGTWVAGPAVLGVVLAEWWRTWRRDRALLHQWLTDPQPRQEATS